MMAAMVFGVRQIKQLKVSFEEFLLPSDEKEAKLKWVRQQHAIHLAWDDIFQMNWTRGLCSECKESLKNIQDWWNLVKSL